MRNPGGVIRQIELISLQNTFIHRIKPLQQFIVTLAFILITTSFDQYSVSQMLPMLLYPAVIIVLGEIPLRLIIRTILPVIPLIILFGTANAFFDKSEWVLLSGVTVSAGWISALALAMRSLMTITAILAFIASAGMNGLFSALEKLKIPDFFITLIAFTFRYIHVLLEEAVHIVTAYRLRAPGQKGILFQNWGALAGQWFIRSYRKAERIHSAMVCRGLSEKIYRNYYGRAKPVDLVWVFFWCSYFVLCRLFPIPLLLGKLTSGLVI